MRAGCRGWTGGPFRAPQRTLMGDGHFLGFSPTSFAWVTRSDTLIVEQKADSIFQFSVRARVR
jgi:hypothetical protein